ncbi:MAG: AAA family ATPase [Sphingomonas bacterium]|nr:AAA family ATPase [Sphingomonas bacterium]
MNNPDNMPVDVEEQREWVLAEKSQRGISWAALGELAGVPGGTLSTFGTGNYGGNNERVAKLIYRYRQLLASQAERTHGLVIAPSFFETPTSRRLRALLIVAHMGRITVGATGPGTGKTITLKEYQASVANCWVATMKPSTETPFAMMKQILRALNMTVAGGGKDQLSQLIADRVRGRRGLLVIDEANHLSLKAIEELRSIHDDTDVGLAMFGNEELLMRIRGGVRSDAFARLNSRIAQSHIQNLPLEEDVEAFCDAWALNDAGMRAMLVRVALTPGAGGLRECRQIVEQASMLANDEGRPLNLSDLRDAQSGRATKHIRG